VSNRYEITDEDDINEIDLAAHETLDGQTIVNALHKIEDEEKKDENIHNLIQNAKSEEKD
jgi:hypothetical protein